MSGAAINRNLCAKHVPVVVNAIKNLEKQVVNKNNVKQLIIKNVKFTPDAYWNSSDSKWQTSEEITGVPASVKYIIDIDYFPDEICNKLYDLMENHDIMCMRINIPLSDDVIDELSDNPDWQNHYVAKRTSDIYSFEIPFSGCSWNRISFEYTALDRWKMTAHICIYGESEIKKMENAKWVKPLGWTPLIQIIDINGSTTGDGVFNFDGVQSVSEKGVRIALPTTSIDVIIEYRE